MTDPSSPPIQNASAIIDRFGGIRPMATKMRIPVTTVQGWKQRGAIPENRRGDLLRAAAENGITLTDLLSGAVGGQKDESFETPDIEIPMSSVLNKNHSAAENLKPQSIRWPLFVAGVVCIVAAVIGSVVAMAPKVKVLSAQEQRIQDLEIEIKKMKAETANSGGIAESLVPDDLKAKVEELQGTVASLSDQAKQYSGILDDLKSGTLPQRLAKLETHMNRFLAQANALGLQQVMAKVSGLQQSSQGRSQLDKVIGSLLQATQGAESAGGTEGNVDPQELTSALENLRQSDPAVAETFQDVAPEDMKAAAILVGLAQLRESLARDNDSFDQDLMLLKATLATDDPELIKAIDRLAPKAKEGVLTPNGLSKEFRSLTGDIVAASLKGEDVSLKEKTTARLGDLLKVEKSGAPILGTETQIKVAEAQKKLDQGDIEGAVQILKQLEGPAAEKTAPFLEQAQVTMLANQLQQMLGQGVLQRLKYMGGGSGGTPYTVNSGGIGGIVDQIQNMVPGQGVVQDPKSGMIILQQHHQP
jgi:hypothetical protein